jgi:hypothetical protein
MNKHSFVKAAFVAVALVMGSTVLKSSNLLASGYMVAMGIDGEPACASGGNNDCPTGS